MTKSEFIDFAKVIVKIGKKIKEQMVVIISNHEKVQENKYDRVVQEIREAKDYIDFRFNSLVAKIYFNEDDKKSIEKLIKESVQGIGYNLEKRFKREEIKELSDLITANILHCTKDVLTSEEAAKYMGVSKGYLYRLTMNKQIPHSKPLGKNCYFERKELEAWLMRNRVKTSEELDQQAQAYCMKKGCL